MSIVWATCPACGGQDLYTKQVPDPDGTIGDYTELRCWREEECPDPDAANRLLRNVEIHHIVRFSEDLTFTVKHPLRERIDDALFDCNIHGVVVDLLDGGLIEPRGSWRMKYIPAVYIPGGPDQEPDWAVEPL